MEKELRYRVLPNIAYREITGKIIFINPAENVLVTLNATGSVFWKYIVQGHTMQQIVRALQKAYDANADAIENDLREFAESMIRRCVIECYED
jgi:hypothetical protein